MEHGAASGRPGADAAFHQEGLHTHERIRMNANQMRALNDVLTNLSRVTDDGMGHSRATVLAAPRKHKQRGSISSGYDYDDGDDFPEEVTRAVSPFPFVSSGKIVLEYKDGDVVTDIVTVVVKDGEWNAEFSKPAPKKRRARKVTATTTMTKEAETALASSQAAPAKTVRKPMSEATKKASAEKRAATIQAKREAQANGNGTTDS